MKNLLQVSLFIVYLCLINFNGFAQTYNVKDYGATGAKEQNATEAIQKTIDACATKGGGMVYLPVGEYTSGCIHLKSNIRFYIEAGATLYSIKDSTAFDKAKPALIFGENLHDISIEGRGTVNGQAAYDWKLNFIHDDLIRANLEAEEATGKPLMRSFPKPDQYGHLIMLINCENVRITGISLINSPSWTLRPIHCRQLVIDGVNIYTDTKYAVWADGIDPDGCQHVRISNCNVETGDDALVLWSMDWFGPAQTCEDITVTNCRFTSASCGIKFCDGNIGGIKHVTIDNCVIIGSNRGIGFMDYYGGEVSDIILSNLNINCIRYDWFWWGDGDPLYFDVRKRSEVTKGLDPKLDTKAGKIKRVLITNVIANGKGSSMCIGNAESWMEDITLNNFKLYISHDTTSDYDKAVYALKFQYVKNLTLKDVDIYWGTPAAPKWTSALALEDIDGVTLDDVTARQAKIEGSSPAIDFSKVHNVVVKNCSPQAGTGTFLSFSGYENTNATIYNNDFTNCKEPISINAFVHGNLIKSEMNINPKP